MLGEAQEESANKGTVVAQSQGANPVALVLWNMLMARTNRPNVEWVLRRQLLQQRLRLLQIERVEALSEQP